MTIETEHWPTEIRLLRDKRTLFVATILPVLLYPLVMLGVAPLINLQKQKLQEERQPIAVTGAAGSVGSALCRKLAAGGAKVLGIDMEQKRMLLQALSVTGSDVLLDLIDEALTED